MVGEGSAPTSYPLSLSKHHLSEQTSTEQQGNTALSSASTLSTSSVSSCSSSGGTSEKHHRDADDDSSLLEGFQWLKIRSSGVFDDPLVNRSYHSHGPLGGKSRSYDEGDDNEHEGLKDYSSSQQRSRLRTARIRSRSESPTSSAMGLRINTLLNDDNAIMGAQRRRPRHAIGGDTGSTSNSSHGASDYQLKNARDALIGSISALINFLRSAGVPRPRYVGVYVLRADVVALIVVSLFLMLVEIFFSVLVFSAARINLKRTCNWEDILRP